MAAAKQADDIMAANQVSLPLDPLPDIVIWSKKLVGPIGDNSIEGPFWNINQWGVNRLGTKLQHECVAEGPGRHDRAPPLY